MNLSISALFIEIALALLPGFIWLKIDRAYGTRKNLSPFDVVLNSFIFSTLSYLCLSLLYKKMGLELKILTLADSDKKAINPEILPEIIYSVITSILLSIIWLYIVNYKILTRFMQTIRSTKTYGDEDVWDFVLNSSSPAVNLVHIRDFEQQVVYSGDVRLFSETEKLRELLLEKVTVFDFDGKKLYEIPSMYVAALPEKVHLEFPLHQPISPQMNSTDFPYTFPKRRTPPHE